MKQRCLKSGLKLFVIIGLLNIGIFAQSDLDTTRWGLTAINGQVVETKAYLNITGNRLSGIAGCNQLFGEAKISGKNIKFARIGTTKMFCTDKGVMKLESDFIKTLGKVTRFKKSGDDLRLFAGNRQILRFRAGLTDLDENSFVKLEDKKWVLETVRNKPLPKIEPEPFINFNQTKGSAGGNTGCNVFGGNYATSLETIKFSGVISTMRACLEDERMRIEKEFKNALEKADRFQIVGGKLNLYAGKNLLLTFRAVNK